jgi:hypothetical protein
MHQTGRVALGGAVSAVAERRWLAGLVALVGVLGIAYVAAMPPGLPYDEPSHWFNVEFYLDHQRMPAIGDDGVTYEAQMGPVAYVLAALVAAPFGSAEAGFYAVRVLGLLQLVALVLVVWRLTHRALPGHPRAALLAAAVAGLDPILLAMSTSVQNDVLAVLLGGVALDLATSPGPWTPRRSAALGLVAGLALLTKVSLWPVAVVLALWLLWKRTAGAAGVYVAVGVLVSGWWFVRNLRLYGDLTGKAGVDEAGYDFPALGLAPGELVRETVTTLWLPVEYVRNAVSAPLLVEGLVVLLTLVGVAGLAVASRRLDDVRLLLAVVAGVAVLGWLVVTVGVQVVSFRIAFPALFAWFVGIGSLATLRRPRPAAVAPTVAPTVALTVGLTVTLVVTLVALNLWFLGELVALDDPGLLPLAGADG